MPRRPGPYAIPAQPEFPDIHYAHEHRPADIAFYIRSGSWERVARGAYISVVPGEQLFIRRERIALARIRALSERGTADRWVSHTSAALLWGLPSLGAPQETHVTQIKLPSTTKNRRASIARHVHLLPDEHRTQHGGIPLTTLARTVVDCARSVTPLAGLMIADAALNKYLDRSRIDEVLLAISGRPGSARARELLDLSDAGSESPGETRLRVAVLRAGFPMPETQIKVTTHLGVFWADAGWKRWRALLEYDGRGKYEDLPTEVLFEEKRRYDAIVEAGYKVLRVTNKDLNTPSTLIRRLVGVLPPSIERIRPPRVLMPGRGHIS